MHSKTYPVTLAPRDEEPSLSSSEEKSSEFGWLERKLTRKQEYIWKTEQVLCSLIYIWYIYITVDYMIPLDYIIPLDYMIPWEQAPESYI